jgi:hypothetical protein
MWGWIAGKPFLEVIVRLILEGGRSKNQEAAERVCFWSASRGVTGVEDVVGNWAG